MSDSTQLMPKGQLKWRCRRGMRELDVMLTKFLDTRYDDLDDRKKLAFQQLLTVQDPVLFKMLIGRLEAQEQRFNEIVQEILATDPNTPATP